MTVTVTVYWSSESTSEPLGYSEPCVRISSAQKFRHAHAGNAQPSSRLNHCKARSNLSGTPVVKCGMAVKPIIVINCAQERKLESLERSGFMLYSPQNQTTDRLFPLRSHSCAPKLLLCQAYYLLLKIPSLNDSRILSPSKKKSFASMAPQISPAQLEVLCQESQQSDVLAMQWFFTVIAVVVVSLRLYCRTKFGKGLGWDDYIFTTGAVGFLPF